MSTALECDKGSIKVVPELFFRHLQSVLPFNIFTVKVRTEREDAFVCLNEATAPFFGDVSTDVVMESFLIC